MKKINWLTAAFILILTLIVIAANLGLGPVYFPFMYSLPGLDKIGHFLLMGILAFLVNLVLDLKKIQLFRRDFLVGSLAVLLVVTLEEISQLFLVFRAFSLLDLIFDLGGILLGSRLAARYKEKHTPEL